MMPLSHLFNIMGCLKGYKDLGAARSWLVRAESDLQPEQFSHLIQSVYRWTLTEILDQKFVEQVVQILFEFDPAGDASRREEIERTRQERVAAHVAQTERDERERIRAEQEHRKRDARERENARRLAKREHELYQQEQHGLEVQARRAAALLMIEDKFRSDFPGADAYFRASHSSQFTDGEFEAHKVRFVRRWLAENTQRENAGTKPGLDDEQLAAIAAVHGHIQVVARAGSGKTTVLVNKALFLLRHCHVDPASMLLLAFNRKAALEIRRRLMALIDENAEEELLSEIDRRVRHAGTGRRVDRTELEADAVDSVAERLKVALPHVMTFHALAYSIVRPEESLLYNGGEGEAQGLSRTFQRVIDDHLATPEYANRIRELMLAHFREDWDGIVSGHYNQTREEFLRFRRSLPRESLRGDYVKSFGEKLIADFLFEHDISYKYERNHWWGEINYRPDFTIFKTPKSGLIVEYFGLAGDPDYDEMSGEKRKYWHSKDDWTLLDFTPRDISDGGQSVFLDLLKVTLEKHEIVCNRLPEDEIWHRVRDRAIDRFTVAVVNFVGRCRKQSLPPDQVRDLIGAYIPLSSVEGLFLDLAHALYAAYLDRLAATGEDDFDGLMQRAAEAVASGKTAFHRRAGSGDLARLRFVFIDEYQDFSDLFHRLLSAIRQASPDLGLFCVGDDWQAINGFAGSDLRFFERFDEFIGTSRRLYISTNYRSSKSIVGIGNALMDGLGKPAVAHKQSPGKVVLVDSTTFKPSLIEKQRHQGDIITPMVSRIVHECISNGSNVVMLSRRNSLPWYVSFAEQDRSDGRGLSSYLELVRSLFPKDFKEQISISTAHKYKGLEKSTVIVMDAVARSYPLIHPDWAFTRILGDSPEKIAQEERRLLYVALTRAVDKLVIVTDGQSKSPFIESLQLKHPLAKIDWDEYPPVRSLSSRLVVKVGNQERRGGAPTFAIKDQLKASGYQWQAAGWPGWAKSVRSDGFKLEALKSELWAKQTDGIEVRIYDEAEDLAGKFLVDTGKWTAVVDKLESLCAVGEPPSA